MFLPDRVIRSRRTVLAGAIRPAAVHIRHGKIIGVMEFDDVPEGCPIDDTNGAVLMPGAVDTHVHVHGPGRRERSGFEATTRAAAAGGITTIVETPADGLPPTTRVGALESTRTAARGKCFIDVGFWGGVMPDSINELAALAAAGVLGFECGLAPCEIPEFLPVTEADLRRAMPAITKLGVPLLVHAELPGPIEQATATIRASRGWFSRLSGTAPDPRKYATYLQSRPKEAENDAIALALGLCREYRTRTHIVHLSSSDALTPLYHARASRLPVTAETCPHYLTFVAEEIPDGATVFRSDPPIRTRENREYLWASLSGGLIQMVTSNHPHVSSLQISLPATWTEARARGYSLNQVAEWMCRAPARLAGLGRKGAIEVGFDADLTIWSPEGEFAGEGAYAGRRLSGIVERTYLRGACIYRRGEAMGTPIGQLIESRSD